MEVYLEDGCMAADLEEAAVLQPRLQEGDERAALEHGELRDGVDWRGGPGVGLVLAVPLAAAQLALCLLLPSLHGGQSRAAGARVLEQEGRFRVFTVVILRARDIRHTLH